MHARQVQRVRAVLLAVVRAIAVALLAYAAWRFVGEAVSRIADAVNPNQMFGSNQTITLTDRLLFFSTASATQRALPLALVAGALALLSKRVVRFIARPPEPACPRCEHAIAPTTTTCAECGYPLVETPANAPASSA